MNKKISLFLVLLTLFTACTSPKSTAKEFLEALNHHEFETALNLVTEDSKPILFELINDQNTQIPPVEITIKECVAVDENDDHVRCLYVVKGNGEAFEKKMHLVSENNEWKIDMTRLIE